MPSKTKIVKLSYIFNDKETTISFDANESFSSFKLLISKTLGINFTEYDLYYMKTQMKISVLQDNMILNEIIGKDTNPVFFMQIASNKSNRLSYS